MSRSPDALYHALPQAATNPAEPNVDPQGDDATLALLDADPPPDVVVDSRIRWIHFILGCAVLLPWNVMITATPFFLARLEGAASMSLPSSRSMLTADFDGAGSPLKLAFSSYLSCAFTLSNFVFLARATVTSKQSSPSRRVLVTTLTLSVLTFLLTISTLVHTGPGVFFAFVLLDGVSQAALGAYLQTAIIVIASLFGPMAVQSVMSGQAAVAVAVSGVQVLSATASVWGKSREALAALAQDNEPEERSALIFFGLSTIFLVITAVANGWLVRMPAYKAVAGSLENRKLTGDPDEIRSLVSAGRNESSNEKAQIWRIAKANALYEIAASYIFIVTLAVFPAITTSIMPTNPKTHPLLFSAIHFLVFNVGDFGGRSLCSFPRLVIWSDKRLLVLSLARTLFIPIFLLCNLQRPSTGGAPPFINSDLVFMCILFAFGMSNGYVSSLCMMSAPSLEHNPRLQGRRQDVDVAATVASFCLVGGLVLGSFLSFWIRSMVCECNPFTERM